jgi:mono/diheme cytochrome c family protein
VTVRHVLIALNLVAVVAVAIYLVWAVLSPKRAPEETLPANLTEFYPDEELESRRLERVQGWALLFAAVVAVALPLYWLHEPARQSESGTYFDENAVERGAVLFSNPAMPKYDSATSLQCANCHGLKGQGGPVPTTAPR